MANTAKALARGSFATGGATIYTVPASTTTVVSNIVITNAATSSATFTLTFDGTDIFKDTTVAANSTLFVDLKQVLATTKVISGAAPTTVKYHISGMEIA
jgi:hypothetical protein